VPLRQLYGLDEIAFSAEAEFQGRKAAGSPEELTVRPWGFPRGGFRHQALSTGVHLESAAECARRELKEECDITLRLHEMENAAQVVVLRTDADNLNPHKGDASRYFLHQVEPDVARNAGKPIQDVMDLTAAWGRTHNKKRPYINTQLLRQKEVHEEFAWFPLKEAMLLTPVFAYMASTREFHDFLGPDVIALAAPVRGSTPATMATQKIPVIASTAPSSSSLRTDNRGSRWDR